MSTHTSTKKRITICDIAARKRQDNASPVVCLTAYTAPMARLLDSHIDLLLVGDSLGMVLYGMDSTLSVTTEMMILHGRAVVKASSQACVVVDLPFGSYQASPEQAFNTASRVLAETGCQAVKIEGGVEMSQTISFLVQRGIPVVAHVGLMPQHVNALGGYRYRGRTSDEQENVKLAARAVEDAGAGMLVLEGVVESLAREVVAESKIPVIGIGASPSCDGQVLVTEDMLGLAGEYVPKFVKRYARLNEDIDAAVIQYASEVRAGEFPKDAQCYFLPIKE